MMNRSIRSGRVIKILSNVALLTVIGMTSSGAIAEAKKCSYKHFVKTGDQSCKTVKANSHKKVRYGCKGKYKGKKLYRMSKTMCGSCPDPYKRNPVQKKSGPKACFLPFGGGEGKFSYMDKVIAAKCPKGQFKHKGVCKSCPEGTKRKHIAGIDTGYCKNLSYKKSK